MRLDDIADVDVRLFNGEQHNFTTLRDALLFAWDNDCKNVKSIYVDDKAIALQEDVWKR